MEKRKDLTLVLLNAILITILFHKKPLGLNLVIFEFVFLVSLVITKQTQFKTKNAISILAVFIITSLFTIIIHSVFLYFTHFFVFLIFLGMLIYPDCKSILTGIGLSLTNILNSQSRFFKELSESELKGKKLGNYLWKFRIFIIPLLVILLFVFLYRKSNPVFDNLTINAATFLGKYLDLIFKDFDFFIVLTFILGLFISNFLYLRTANKNIIKNDLYSTEFLERRRSQSLRSFKLLGLKNEYKAGIFLLVVLNCLILIINIIDINWVWFNFEWEGQYLKQFVHEGTYLLILSILISIALVLFYFRGNLNFYKKNKTLKILSYLWLAQNGILTISVGIRNLLYIQHFSLAYKRIGVIIFLVLTLYGLITVLIKVQNKKSTFYLFRTNAYAIFLVLALSSLINWDIVIAKYNFRNYEKSFLHLDFMAILSDKSLPYLDKPLTELKQIDKLQKEKFPFDQKFMTPEKYYEIIQGRKNHFKEKWNSKTFLSWNLPEYLAYRRLNK